ncbi:hypothetical protein [Streptomyces sp. NBC_00989]|nr:hypothetical protein OG714_12290 [Streptomyces sp. NBC_00989]
MAILNDLGSDTAGEYRLGFGFPDGHDIELSDHVAGLRAAMSRWR